MLQNARVLIANYDALVSTYFIVAIIYILVNFGVNQLAIYVSHRSGAKIVTQTNIEPV
jgi:glutamate transport system permease protein